MVGKTDAEKQPCTLFSHCLGHKEWLTHSPIRKKEDVQDLNGGQTGALFEAK